MPEPQQRRIWAMSATHTTAHSNARSLTQWARAGIEPETSWFLVRFINHWATTGTPKLFLSVQFSGIKYIHHVVEPTLLCIFRIFSSFQNETLYPLNNKLPTFPFPHLLQTVTLLSFFFFFPFKRHVSIFPMLQFLVATILLCFYEFGFFLIFFLRVHI